MSVKFHEKAIAIFGCAQNLEGNSVIKSQAETTGTITATTGSATVTGAGTKFQYGAVASDGLGEVAVGAYLYNAAGAVIGRVLSIESQTSLTLEANGSNAATAEEWSVGLGPKNALAVLNLNYSTELDTEAFQYAGDELSRDEETVIKDKYAKFDFETFIPSLGTIAGTDPLASEVPMVEWFNSAGMQLVLSTASGGYAKFTNSEAANVYMTVEIRRSSPDIPTLQKAFVVSNTRGTIDLDATVGTRGKLKWTFMGNLDAVVDKAKIDPDFGDQKTEHAGSIKSTTIVTAQLETYTGATPPTYVETTKSVCFDKVNAPNLAGFDYARYLTGCVDGWSKGATPTDVTLTILEDKAGATYNPDNHLEENHALIVDYGSTTGKKVQLYFDKLQLAKVTNSKVASYTGQDLGFRNVGYITIKLS